MLRHHSKESCHILCRTRFWNILLLLGTYKIQLSFRNEREFKSPRLDYNRFHVYMKCSNIPFQSFGWLPRKAIFEGKFFQSTYRGHLFLISKMIYLLWQLKLLLRVTTYYKLLYCDFFIRTIISSMKIFEDSTLSVLRLCNLLH